MVSAVRTGVVALTFMLACFQAHANTAVGISTIGDSEEAQELERTWLKGALMFPKELSDQLGIPAGEITRIDKVVDRLPTLKFIDPMPLALLVHGCFGIGQEQIEQAKSICRQCSVSAQCLEYAIKENQDTGVWGGLSEDERRSLKRRYARARRAS